MSADYNQFFKKVKRARQEEEGPRRAQFPVAGAKVKKVMSRQIQSQANENAARRMLKMDKPVPQRAKSSNTKVVASVLVCTALVAGLLWGNQNQEKIDGLMNAIEFRVFGEALAEGGDGKKVLAAKDAAEKSAAGKGGEKTAKAQTKETWTPEEVTLFKKLDERKKALDLREAEQTKLEEELQKQKVEVDKKLKELVDLRQKIAKQLEDKVQEDQGRVDKLVQVYSNMKPTNAAKIFEQINEDLAVEVLSKMKQKNAAEILNLLPPDKSQRLSEKFAGYKRK